MEQLYLVKDDNNPWIKQDFYLFEGEGRFKRITKNKFYSKMEIGVPVKEYLESEFIELLPFAQRIGIVLKRFRLRKNLSQEEVAIMIGKKTGEYISRVENGVMNMQIDLLAKILKVLDLDLRIYEKEK